jgi:hypothetical protein
MKKCDRKKLNKNVQTREEKTTESKKEVVLLEKKTFKIATKDEICTADKHEPKKEITCLKTINPPCIRVILVGYTHSDNESHNEKQKLGSLYLIPYTGGSIGRSPKNRICFSTNQKISKSHAVVTYDMTKKAYFIQGIFN